MALPRAPQRLLFIASIGNPAPYRTTRHSAGHILLDAVTPHLRARLNPSISPLYTTFYSPSLMNISGPKVVKNMTKWLSSRDALALDLPGGPLPTGTSTGYPATLVILHDELEAPLGKVRVKRGGPESASLRGHRGLISILETLRGKGLFTGKAKQGAGSGQMQGQGKKRGKEDGLARELDVLRVGVGIGRPLGREKDAVADYVLTEMEGRELDAVNRAAESVVDVLEEEIYRVG
ncbi:Peptidyl-tRNA hydrolase [Penicillium rolfsii]|nr:Peptidyl-tRNA hydrolase [Penicillium rolfsii]